MRFSIIGTVGLPSSYGGFETLVENLVSNNFEGFRFIVYCSSKSYSTKNVLYKNARLIYLPLNANGIQSIFYDILSMMHSLIFFPKNDFLILGVSGCIFLPFIKLLGFKNRIIVNIDGLEWKRNKWNRFAKSFLKFSEAIAVKFADDVISDNKVIQDYVQREYGKYSHLITYGGDNVGISRYETSSMNPLGIENYAFMVCRIEPENNIHLILDAFSSEKVSLNLIIVGNWNSSKYGQDLRQKYSILNNKIFLLDPIYDLNVLNLYRKNCFIYVHGHSAGGTNPSLVEALCLGLYPVCFNVAYNVETTKGSASFFDDVDGLIEIILKLDPAEVELKKIHIKKFANCEYAWSSISKQYYSLMIKGGNC